MAENRSDGWHFVQVKGSNKWFAGWWRNYDQKWISGVGIYEVPFLVHKVGPHIPTPDESPAAQPAPTEGANDIPHVTTAGKQPTSLSPERRRDAAWELEHVAAMLDAQFHSGHAAALRAIAKEIRDAG